MARQCTGSTGLIAEIVEAWAREAFRKSTCRVAVTVTRARIARVHTVLVSAAVGAHEATSSTSSTVALVLCTVVTVLPCFTSEACNACGASICRVVLAMHTLLTVACVRLTQRTSGAEAPFLAHFTRGCLELVLITTRGALCARGLLLGRLIMASRARDASRLGLLVLELAHRTVGAHRALAFWRICTNCTHNASRLAFFGLVVTLRTTGAHDLAHAVLEASNGTEFAVCLLLFRIKLAAGTLLASLQSLHISI